MKNIDPNAWENFKQNKLSDLENSLSTSEQNYENFINKYGQTIDNFFTNFKNNYPEEASKISSTAQQLKSNAKKKIGRISSDVFEGWYIRQGGQVYTMQVSGNTSGGTAWYDQVLGGFEVAADDIGDSIEDTFNSFVNFWTNPQDWSDWSTWGELFLQVLTIGCLVFPLAGLAESSLTFAFESISTAFESTEAGTIATDLETVADIGENIPKNMDEIFDSLKNSDDGFISFDKFLENEFDIASDSRFVQFINSVKNMLDLISNFVGQMFKIFSKFFESDTIQEEVEEEVEELKGEEISEIEKKPLGEQLDTFDKNYLNVKYQLNALNKIHTELYDVLEASDRLDVDLSSKVVRFADEDTNIEYKMFENIDGLDPDIDDSFLKDIDYDFGGKYDYDVEGSLETVVESVKMSQPLISLIIALPIIGLYTTLGVLLAKKK